jgi:hypothetical protein
MQPSKARNGPRTGESKHNKARRKYCEDNAGKAKEGTSKARALARGQRKE